MMNGYVIKCEGLMLARRHKTRTKEAFVDAGGFHWTDDIQAARVFSDLGSAEQIARITGGKATRIERSEKQHGQEEN